MCPRIILGQPTSESVFLQYNGCGGSWVIYFVCYPLSAMRLYCKKNRRSRKPIGLGWSFFYRCLVKKNYPVLDSPISWHARLQAKSMIKRLPASGRFFLILWEKSIIKRSPVLGRFFLILREMSMIKRSPASGRFFLILWERSMIFSFCLIFFDKNSYDCSLLRSRCFCDAKFSPVTNFLTSIILICVKCL